MFRPLILAALMVASSAYADTALLNVSYDVTREFYREYNTAFINYWKQKTGETVTVNQAHGGSSKQVRSVADGLEADVVTMNQSNDIDVLYERGKLIPKDWQKRLPKPVRPLHPPRYFWCAKAIPSVSRIGMIWPSPAFQWWFLILKLRVTANIAIWQLGVMC